MSIASRLDLIILNEFRNCLIQECIWQINFNVLIDVVYLLVNSCNRYNDVKKVFIWLISIHQNIKFN